MKKLNVLVLAFAVATLAFLGSCTSVKQSMREPNVHIELTKSDYSLSEQVSAEAQTTKILSIDLARLFKKETGNLEGGAAMGISLATIPVVGTALADQTANYALYNMMQANPGYDFVMYPQYHTKVVKPVLGIGAIMTITNVKATARLGKLKN